MRWITLLSSVNAALLLAVWTVFALALRAAVRNVPLLSDALANDPPGSGGRAQVPSRGAPPAADAVLTSLSGTGTAWPAPPGTSAALLSPPVTGTLLPALTVVVAARDEGATIERTVRSILAQRYDALQLVVVDDRSTDGTGEVLGRLAAEASQGGRLDVVPNASLPEGWLGKCHACRLGAARGRGAWILFMDGDVTLVEDDLLARVVQFAERAGLDHVAILPDMRPMPHLQSAIVSAFGQGFLIATRTYEMDRDLPRGGVGVGAFNLIRRSAYDRVGGHERLKMDPGDDVKLGMLLKASGARQRLFDGFGLVRCRWQQGALNVIRGFEKNGFSGCDYSLLKLVAVTVFALWMALGPLGAAVGATACIRAAVVIGWLPLLFQAALLLVGFSIARRRGDSENPLVATILYPLGVTLMVVAMWNSAVRTLAKGGISWRGTFYPLDALRRGLVRPGDLRAEH